MAWAKIDDGLDEHPKVDAMLEDDELSALAAVGLWVLTLANTSRRDLDGKVSRRTLRKIAPEHGERLAAVLREARLYDADGADHVIHDFLVYNPSATDRAATAEARSAAGKAGANARWHSKSDATGDALGDGKTDAQGDDPAECDRNAPVPDPTRPVPEPDPQPVARGRAWGLDQLPNGEDMPTFVAGFLKRGCDDLTDPGEYRTPTPSAVAGVLAKHPDAPRALILDAAQDARGTIQSQGWVKNPVTLFSQKLAEAMGAAA